MDTAQSRTGWAAPRGPFPHALAPLRPDGLAAVHRRCGILAHGFARIRCDACPAERLVAISSNRC